jgi:hypothetical protein
MSRGPYPFRESDLIRAHRANGKAGHPDAIIEIDIERRCLRIIPRKLGEENSSGDPASVMTPEDLREQI